jgi:hypothetical protein
VRFVFNGNELIGGDREKLESRIGSLGNTNSKVYGMYGNGKADPNRATPNRNCSPANRIAISFKHLLTLALQQFH